MNAINKSFLLVALLIGLVGCIEPKATDNSALESIDLDAESVDAVVYSLDKTTSEAAEEEASPFCIDDGNESEISVNYNNTPIPGTRLTANGFVSLYFNNPNCSISNIGDIVNRTYGLNITNAFGHKYVVTSENQRNYAGDVLGGGGYLENTSGGWLIEVAGRHEEFYGRRGRKLMDVSIETGAPIEVVGTLNRANRVITSGQLLVHHNLARFTASYASRGLTWTSACKCPVSGALLVDYSNRASKRGAEVQFNECGSATITFDNGESRDLKLRRCLE